MTVVFMLAAIAVIAVVALLAVGRLGELPDVEGDRAPLALPDDRPLDGDDVDGVRFAVGLRGYRMDEVDDVLDRLSGDIAARDARIAVLESQLAGGAALVGTQDSPPVHAPSTHVADPTYAQAGLDQGTALVALNNQLPCSFTFAPGSESKASQPGLRVNRKASRRESSSGFTPSKRG